MRRLFLTLFIIVLLAGCGVNSKFERTGPDQMIMENSGYKKITVVKDGVTTTTETVIPVKDPSPGLFQSLMNGLAGWFNPSLVK